MLQGHVATWTLESKKNYLFYGFLIFKYIDYLIIYVV